MRGAAFAPTTLGEVPTDVMPLEHAAVTGQRLGAQTEHPRRWGRF
jgi:hypothetical protein